MTIRLERISTQTLLGIRFWDPAIGRQVGDGLRVTAQRLSADGTRRIGRAIVARLTQSGVYAFFGLHPAERADEAPHQFWEEVPPVQQVVIDVLDALERYLPMSFSLDIPHRRAFVGRADWVTRSSLSAVLPDDQKPGVFVWSAANRSAPAGQTMIRGQLVIGNADAPLPAANALVSVLTEDGTAYVCGLTDAAGRLALPLAYPPIPEPADNAPHPPLSQQTFGLQLRVYFNPAEQHTLPGSNLPDLASILAQSQARIGIRRRINVDPPQLTTRQTMSFDLPYGVPFILRTPIANTQDSEPFLRVEPV